MIDKECLECKVKVHESETCGSLLNEDGTFHICESSKFVNDALQKIAERSFSGRHPELGKMINCHVCHDRHRQNERNCQIVYHKIDGVEQIAGETKSTKFDTTFELDIQRKQTRQVFGAKLFKGRRKNRRNKPTKPTHHWVRLIQEKHAPRNHSEG